MVKLVRKRPGGTPNYYPRMDYFKMAENSQGFDVNSDGIVFCGGIVEMTRIDDHVIEAAEAAEAAVDMYNETHNSNLIFESVVKANGQMVGGFMYYITLRARLPTHKRCKVYQAKVWLNSSCDLELDLFRERPKSSAKFAKKPKHLFLPKGAFVTFMNDLRKHPDVHEMKHSDVTRLASTIWRSMSPHGKKRYFRTRKLESKDIAAGMKGLLGMKSQEMK